MVVCLKNATSSCPALTDVSHERINAPEKSSEVFTKCGLPLFAAATTTAPLGLLNSKPVIMDNSTVTTTKTKTDVGQLVLIILGTIVIVATIIVIIIVVCVSVRRRRTAHRRSIFKDWRPNGQKVYRDEPQFVSTNIEHSGFRPINYSNRSGFLNEAVIVD
jgi:hypothetical protein